MDHKDFDDIIRKKLESLSSDGADDGWDLFHEKWKKEILVGDESLDEDPTEDVLSEADVDAAFDQKIKENLSSLRMPFNSQHWVQLKAKLEAEALFKKRLFVAKTVEVLMLILIVIGVLNVIPVQNEIYKIPIYDVPMVAAVPVGEAMADQHHHHEVIHLQEVNKNPIVKAINTLAGINVGSEIPSVHGAVDFATAMAGHSTAQPTSNEKGSLEHHSHTHHSDRPSPAAGVHYDDDRNVSRTCAPLAALVLPLSGLQSADDQMQMPYKLGFVPIDHPAKASYLNIALGPKVNLVNSPFDPVYKVDPYSTLNTNFNIGIKLEKEVGPVTAHVGLGYHNTSYEPLPVEELYERRPNELNETSLEKIAFSTIDIPIGVRYDLIDNPKFDVYATGGVALNVIGEAQYDVRDTPFGRAAPSSPPVATPDRSPEVNEQARLSKKDFTKGVFQGGRLTENMYATASLGLGMSKKLSHYASVYVEPKYSHFISPNGIGPNEDKLHAVSVDFGVRFRLD